MYRADINQQLGGRIVESKTPVPAGLNASEPVGIEAIVEHVAQNGALVLPEVIGGEALDAMRAEFRSLIDRGEAIGFPVNRHEGGVNVRVDRGALSEAEYPAISAFYSADIFHKVAARYFHGQSFHLNTEIFVHETPPTDTPLSGALHFDKRHTFKFWIYLDDLPAEAGATLIVPGSITENRRLREAATSKAASFDDVENITPERASQAVPLTGAAGSIMILDTDCYHGAAPVTPGHVRRIMRGHCRSEAEVSSIKRLS
jgi:ectoine hydroxylase-related dioxygenase (phytanoyl-CoA dioxygenase family)